MVPTGNVSNSTLSALGEAYLPGVAADALEFEDVNVGETVPAVALTLTARESNEDGPRKRWLAEGAMRPVAAAEP